MDFGELERKLAEERAKYIDIIRDIESGNDQAVDRLDHAVFNERNRRLFLLNAQALKGFQRYSGKPYYQHPASTAFLFSLFCGMDKPHADRTVGYILTHDLLDEASYYKSERFAKFRDAFEAEGFKDEVNTAIMLAEPDFYTKLSAEFSIKQAKKAGFN